MKNKQDQGIEIESWDTDSTYISSKSWWYTSREL